MRDETFNKLVGVGFVLATIIGLCLLGGIVFVVYKVLTHFGIM